MLFVAFNAVVLICQLVAVQGDTWTPNSWEHCRTNVDCNNTAHVCCSVTPAFGRRRRQLLLPLEVHYCLPYKTSSSPWCSLRLQYSSSAHNYHGLCPCGPGLKCAPSAELDPKSYPRETFGRCTPV